MRAVFTGKQATMKQQLDDGTWMDAVADRIDYDIKTEIITLTGSYRSPARAAPMPASAWSTTPAPGDELRWRWQPRAHCHSAEEQERGGTAGRRTQGGSGQHAGQAGGEQEVMLVAKGLRKR